MFPSKYTCKTVGALPRGFLNLIRCPIDLFVMIDKQKNVLYMSWCSHNGWIKAFERIILGGPF